jgi:endonuclease/exonuclease/phosphatase family metal-dependent hydrolase
MGYAKGIDGSLRQHVGYFGRHFYSAIPVQEQVLSQLKSIIVKEDPDLCCFVEIDRGSIHSAGFNQIEALLDARYAFHDIADKYGRESYLGRLPLHHGKSNALMAKQKLPFERLYFRHGTKRLIYKVLLPPENMGKIQVYFAHFSLIKSTRMRQFEEVEKIMRGAEGEIILLADFNILEGFKELKPLLKSEELIVMNKEKDFTFNFSGRRLALDLCLCTRTLASRLEIKIIEQPFSDHAALLVNVS